MEIEEIMSYFSRLNESDFIFRYHSSIFLVHYIHSNEDKSHDIHLSEVSEVPEAFSNVTWH